MKNIKLTVLSVLVSFAAACGGGGVETIDKLKDEACACKDKGCAESVNKKLDEAIEKMSEPSEADGKKIMASMAAAGVCLAKYL